MTDLRELFLDNPELWRNLRIELNSKRMLTAGILTAVFALVVLPSILLTKSPGTSAYQQNNYVIALLWSQKITLTLGGAISCWRAVRRERELNTYDFQRITRLSPLELAVGKLFGAPALAYFVTLCLVLPSVFLAMTKSGAALAQLVPTYILLFTSAILIHAFALMISTISDKGGTVGGVVILLLLQMVFPAIGWLFAIGAMTNGGGSVFRFYGMPLPLTLLWAGLELGFTAWFLLAVVRNIKIDLEAMQLFTVRQGLGFAVYCNFVWIGFVPWGLGWGDKSAGSLLLLCTVFFYAVGIGVLQSRELVRRELRESRAAFSESGRWLGPIGLLVIGAVLTEIVIVVLAEQSRAGDMVRRIGEDLFLVLYFAAWVARDLFYIQWMKIRPVRSPLRKAFLYLFVFYLSIAIVFRSALNSVDTAAFVGWLAPFSAVLSWRDVHGNSAPAMWLMALMAQLVAAAAFAYLYHQQVVDLGSRPKAVPPVSPARLSSTTP